MGCGASKAPVQSFDEFLNGSFAAATESASTSSMADTACEASVVHVVRSKRDTMFAGDTENMYRVWDIIGATGDAAGDGPPTEGSTSATLEAADPAGHFWVLRRPGAASAADGAAAPSVTCLAVEGQSRACLVMYDLRPLVACEAGTPTLSLREVAGRLQADSKQLQTDELVSQMARLVGVDEGHVLTRLATVRATNANWVSHVAGDDHFEWRLGLREADASSAAAATYDGANRRFRMENGEVKGHLAFTSCADARGVAIVQNQSRHGEMAVRVAAGHDAMLFACLAAVKDKVQDTFPRGGN